MLQRCHTDHRRYLAVGPNHIHLHATTTTSTPFTAITDSANIYFTVIEGTLDLVQYELFFRRDSFFLI